MSDIANAGVQLALIALILMMIPCAYRVAAGPSPADRLQAIDTLNTLLIGVIVVLALLQGQAFVVDVGIALAAFGFVGTLAVARYLSDGNVF